MWHTMLGRGGEGSRAVVLHLGLLAADPPEIDLDEVFSNAGLVHGRFLEGRAMLRSLDPAASPTLRSVEISWGCRDVVG